MCDTCYYTSLNYFTDKIRVWHPILMNLDHARDRRRGQSRTVTLVNEIAEDVSYVNLNVRDVAKLTSKQFKQVIASFIQ